MLAPWRVLLFLCSAVAQALVKRRKTRVIKDFCFSLKPILQVIALALTTRFVQFLSARPHPALHHAPDQSLLLFPASLNIHSFPKS